MVYLAAAVLAGFAFVGWLWWAAKHAPLLDEHERTCPPYEPPPKR